MYRNIEKIIQAPLVAMGNIKLRQPLPIAGLQQLSPFILLHHFDINMQPGHNNFDVPPHPHRGFMPITFMYEGEVEHNDSLGNTHITGNDEVQWINAARGIIHSEKTGKAFAEKGGRFHGIQLWINLPASEKMKTPGYQPITKEEIVLMEDKGVQFRLVSGKYKGEKGPANSDVITAMIRMQEGSDYAVSLPENDNVFLYVLEGEIKINLETTAKQHSFIVFKYSKENILLHANSQASLLLGSGNPIDEPLVTHGPFVMNTQTEILEAMRDYQNGKMGFLY
ncbi:MAG TPA: pirin family protein [Chitinophagaceae bacterium]|nr:pirin family protein [Chitinophagaceae bacterium]